MVERARVQPKALDLARPRNLDAAIEQKTTRARSDQARRNAEEAELALARYPKIQLEDAFVTFGRHEHVRLKLRIAQQLRHSIRPAI